LFHQSLQMQVQNSLCSLFNVYANCEMMQLFLIYAKKMKIMRIHVIKNLPNKILHHSYIWNMLKLLHKIIMYNLLIILIYFEKSKCLWTTSKRRSIVLLWMALWGWPKNAWHINKKWLSFHFELFQWGPHVKHCHAFSYYYTNQNLVV
jgi:hypothetical protein